MTEFPGTRPLVAIYGNHGGPGWISRILTVEDIVADLELSLEIDSIKIPRAHMISDNIELSAKGGIGEGDNNGAFYTRYKKLDAIMITTNGEHNPDLFGARKKFEAYQPDGG